MFVQDDLSVNHLGHVLARLQLYRRLYLTDFDEEVAVIRHQLATLGQLQVRAFEVHYQLIY